MQLKVNGKLHEVQSPPDTPLLWVLREELGLTGAKYGCGEGLCGACTVHLDGSATRSCMVPLSTVEDAAVTTIEGLGNHPLKKAWLEEEVVQCGYCQTGMLMAAAALLAEKPHLTSEELCQRLTNLCRCGTYPRILRAVLKAAG